MTCTLQSVRCRLKKEVVLVDNAIMDNKARERYFIRPNFSDFFRLIRNQSFSWSMRAFEVALPFMTQETFIKTISWIKKQNEFK